MKRKLIFTALLIAGSSLFASDFKFSVTPEAGLLNGQINEYVFTKSSQASTDKLSELNWQIKNIPYAQVRSDIWYKNLYTAGGAFRIALPKKSGTMVDRDWINIEYRKTLYDGVDFDNECLTNWSESNNKLDMHYEFSGFLGVKLPLTQKSTLGFSLSGSYSFYSFKATDGKGNYGKSFYLGGKYPVSYVDANGKNQYEEFPFTGDVISYKQEHILAWLGMDFETNALPFMKLRTAGYIAPLGKIQGLDTHHLKSRNYLDVMKNPVTLKGELELRARFTKRHEAGLFTSINYTPEKKGETYQKRISANTFNLDNGYLGGTSNLIWSSTLNYTYRF